MSTDVYKHDTISAIAALAESLAIEATLTWDGATDYRVQPSAKYVSLDSNHVAILTRTDLEAWNGGGELVADDIEAASLWLASMQRQWFNFAHELDRASWYQPEGKS